MRLALYTLIFSILTAGIVSMANENGSDESEKCQRQLMEANREAWNEVAPLHHAASWETRVSNFSKPGFSDLNALETEYLLRLGLKGRRVVHPCCNSGEELLSMVNLGAVNSTGFDISEAFIAQATELARAARISCEFVRCNIYDIPESYHGQYDLVYISVGTLGWMPDINGFFRKMTALLRPGGHIFIYESHPALDMYSVEEERGLNPVYSYFRRDPIVETDSLDYVGQTDYVSKKKYWFHHTMSDVIQALIDNGIRIETFRELDHDRSMDFQHFNALEVKPPLSYILIGSLR